MGFEPIFRSLKSWFPEPLEDRAYMVGNGGIEPLKVLLQPFMRRLPFPLGAITRLKLGAECQTRTDHLLLTKQLLYQMS